jgi:hypothetical protein
MKQIVDLQLACSKHEVSNRMYMLQRCKRLILQTDEKLQFCPVPVSFAINCSTFPASIEHLVIAVKSPFLTLHGWYPHVKFLEVKTKIWWNGFAMYLAFPNVTHVRFANVTIFQWPDCATFLYGLQKNRAILEVARNDHVWFTFDWNILSELNLSTRVDLWTKMP